MSPSRGVFPPEPLDLRDRLILEVICKYGREGQSFNKLVKEVRDFASRSTFALRVERLQRLGYVEKFPDKERKQVKRIRGRLQTRMLLWMIKKSKEDIAEIEKLLSKKEDELSKQSKELPSEQVEAFEVFIRRELERIMHTFSSVAIVAVTYGEAAAGDIFLPSVVESFQSVMLKLASIIKKSPELTKAAFPIKEVKRFFEEFGEEILEKISEPLRSRKAIIEEVMKHPEKLDLLVSTLWP